MDPVEDLLVSYLASKDAAFPRDGAASADEATLELLCAKGHIATAEAFVRAKVGRPMGAWLLPDGLAIVAAARAARGWPGDSDAARALLAEAKVARGKVLDDGTRSTLSILAGGGDLALLVRFWHVEKLLGDERAAKVTWAEQEAAAPGPPLRNPVHLFRAWLAAGEPARAIATAKRADPYARLNEDVLAELARRVDGASLTKYLAELPPFEGPALHQLRMASMEGAVLRGDHRTIEQAVFDALPPLVRFDPQHLLESGVDTYLRAGDVPHAAALVERWRAKERVSRPVPFAAMVARTRGAKEAAARSTGDAAMPPIARAVALWLIEATDGARSPTLPSLGMLADDPATLDAIIAELRAYRPSSAVRGGWNDAGGRARVLAGVLGATRGESGWASLEADAKKLEGASDQLAAVAWGAAEAGNLDVASRLLANVVAEDERLEKKDPVGYSRRWEAGRLGRAYAARGDIPSLVRTLRLDHHAAGARPNAITYALVGLPSR